MLAPVLGVPAAGYDARRARDPVPGPSPPAFSALSRWAQLKTPFDIVLRSSAARWPKTSARTLCTPASSGAACAASSARWPARRRSPAAASSDARSASRAGAAGQRRHLGRDGGVGRRLEAGRVAVVPAAVEPPEVADDELGLVVDRAEVRLLEQVGRRLDRVRRCRRGGRPRSSAPASARRATRAARRRRCRPARCGRRRGSGSRGRAAAPRRRAAAILRRPTAHSRG